MKKILYLFDDINYPSGARTVAFMQMKCLREHYQVDAFSLCRPLAKSLSEQKSCGIRMLGEMIWEESELYARPLLEVLFSHERLPWQKLKRIWNAISKRIRKAEPNVEKILGRELRQQFETYDAIVVVSEASRLRTVVSCLRHPRKIQWIHTDYALWSRFSSWTRMVTALDKQIYEHYDWIVNLSEHSRSGFVQKHPHLQEKTIVIPNLVDGDRILAKSNETWSATWKDGVVHLVSVGRTDKEKAYDRVLDYCGRLKEEGVCLCWHIAGDGPLLGHLKKRVRDEGLTGYVELLGRLENPYPLMKKCDWLVLLSEYEGTPVTIDEAMVLGLAIAAVDVGGIREQMSGYEAGVVLAKERLYEDLKQVVKKKMYAKPTEYKKKNECILHSIEQLL